MNEIVMENSKCSRVSDGMRNKKRVQKSMMETAELYSRAFQCCALKLSLTPSALLAIISSSHLFFIRDLVY